MSTEKIVMVVGIKDKFLVEIINNNIPDYLFNKPTLQFTETFKSIFKNANKFDTAEDSYAYGLSLIKQNNVNNSLHFMDLPEISISIFDEEFQDFYFRKIETIEYLYKVHDISQDNALTKIKSSPKFNPYKTSRRIINSKIEIVKNNSSIKSLL